MILNGSMDQRWRGRSHLGSGRSSGYIRCPSPGVPCVNLYADGPQPGLEVLVRHHMTVVLHTSIESWRDYPSRAISGLL